MPFDIAEKESSELGQKLLKFFSSVKVGKIDSAAEGRTAYPFALLHGIAVFFDRPNSF